MAEEQSELLLSLPPAFWSRKYLLKAVPRQLIPGMVQQEAVLVYAALLASPAPPDAVALARSIGRHGGEVSSP